MHISSRGRVTRTFAATALGAVALTLSACVSNNSTIASPASTPTTAPGAKIVPGQTPPTAGPIPTVSQGVIRHDAAVVSGTPIAGSTYAEAVRREYLAVAQQQQTQGAAAQRPSDKQVQTAAIQGLIQRMTVDLYAHRHGITASSNEVQSQYKATVQRYGGQARFARALKNFGYTATSLQTLIADSITTRKVAALVAPLPKRFEEARARHILVKSKTLADKIYSQLSKNPSRFAALARKYSVDTGSAANGGELGYFGRGQMVTSFDRAAFTLPIGTISSPVQSQFGFHIIQVEARRTVSLAKSSPQNQQQAQQAQQLQFQTWLKGEERRDNVKILVPGLQ